MKETTKETFKILIKYSILFGVMVVGVYFFFLIDHKSFIQYGDGYRQGYFWTVELKHHLEALFAGDGFSRWSWFKGLGAEVTLPTDPFNIIAALFPVGYIELGFTFAILLRMYCSGLAFILFARELDMSSVKCIVGSICYVFAGWVVGTGLVQANFIINTVLFPLLILGVEKIYKKKSPALFVLAVAYYVIRNIVFAYMAAIMVVIYIFIRYFAYNDELSIKKYVGKIGVFIFYGMLGIMISMVALLPSFMSLSGASTEAASTTNALLYTADNYYNLLTRIIAGRFDGLGGYSYLGISAFLITILPLGFRKFSIRKTPAVMVTICFVMYLFPFFGRMFNGFSYTTGRWTFMFLFFIIWCAVDVMDLEKLREKKSVMTMSVTWVALAICTCGSHIVGLITLTESILLFTTMNLIGALAAIVIIFIGGESEKRSKVRDALFVIIILGTIVVTYNLSFHGNLDLFLRNNKINTQLEASTQRVGNMIEDEGFYRIDQVDGVVVHKVTCKPANETLWWQTRSLYTYDSKLPATYLKFNKLVGNNSSYTERVTAFSNDNRMGLDFLMGVKYFLGNDVNEESPSSQYAGYGFKYAANIDGVDILENKYDVGLGFVYDSYIRESEFMKLSRLQREQALMQSVVVSDEEADDIEEISEHKATDISTDIKNIKYSIVETKGLEMNDGTIVADEAGAYFIIEVSDVKNSQLIVSFDDLIQRDVNRPEGGSFEMLVENEHLTKRAYNKLGNQGMPDITDYDVNMGYYDDYSGKIKVTLSEQGIYDFDKLYITAMGTELYDRCAKQLTDNKLVISEFGDEYVAGTVDCNKNGVLYLSMLNNDNWKVFVDGEAVEKLSVANIAFTGVELTAGHHEIQLKYSNNDIIFGAVISIIGLLALIVICTYMWYNRKKKNNNI